VLEQLITGENRALPAKRGGLSASAANDWKKQAQQHPQQHPQRHATQRAQRDTQQRTQEHTQLNKHAKHK
jgi:hypothetical protein